MYSVSVINYCTHVPDFEAIKVTLRRKSDGFGIHLSGGLPPISVIFVQPGNFEYNNYIQYMHTVLSKCNFYLQLGILYTQGVKLKVLV